MEYDPELPVWAIQPDESSSLHEYFIKYRDLGPKRTNRALAEATLDEIDGFEEMSEEDRARKIKMRTNHFWETGKKWDWPARARAYDAMLDAEKVEAVRAAQRETIARATKNHQAMSGWLTALVGKAVQIAIMPKTDKQKKKIEDELDKVGLGTMIDYVRSVIDIERRALDMDSAKEADRAEGSATRGRATMSIEEIKQIMRDAVAELPPPPTEAPDLPQPPLEDGEEPAVLEGDESGEPSPDGDSE